MKTTKEERTFYRETARRGGFTEGLNLGTVMAILSRDFVRRLLDDIEELENELSKDREVFLKIIEETNR